MKVSRAIRATGISAVGALLGLALVGYDAGPVSNAGTIRGTVRMTGSPPALAPHQVTKANHQPVCGRTVVNDEVVTGTGGALANAVVFIDGIQRGAPAPRRNIEIDQQGCRFVPRVQATTRGSQLAVTSSDATLHNIHARIGQRTIFNLAMPTKGIRVQRPLNQPGLIEVNCDAGHTWMHASIHVFDHPYFAVTGRDGAFELRNVPPGEHTVKIWHERFGTQTRRITVEPGGSATWDAQVR